MYDWLLGHRGDDDAQLELRALFGLPVAVAGPLEVFAVAASSLAAGVRVVEQVTGALGAGAAALVDDTAAEGVGAALSLALAGADGQVTFSRATRAAFAEHLCFVRARRRPGWRLPVPCVALAEAPYTRDVCRRDAATLRSDGAFVARALPTWEAMVFLRALSSSTLRSSWSMVALSSLT